MIDDCDTPKEYQRLHAELCIALRSAEDRLQHAWDVNDTVALTKAAIAMKYSAKAMEELMLKEDEYGIAGTTDT